MKIPTGPAAPRAIEASLTAADPKENECRLYLPCRTLNMSLARDATADRGGKQGKNDAGSNDFVRYSVSSFVPIGRESSGAGNSR